MWITPVATASIMVPAAVGLLAQMGCLPGSSRFGKGLLMAVAWGSLSGGIATPAGATTNPIVIGFLHNLANVEIGFLDWIRIGIPTLVVLIPCAWLLLVWLFPPEMEHCKLSASSAGISPQPGGLNSNQLRTALLMSGAITIWIVSPAGWSSWSALLFGVILFTPYIGFLRWQDAERAISWEALLVVAAGIAIGNAAYQSNLARYLAHIFFAQMLVALPPFWRDIALSWATALIHALFSSNTVTGSIVAPLLIPLAQELKLDVWRTVAPAAYSVSLAFLLVSEGPTSLIAYQTGYFSARDFTRAGLLFTLITGPILALMLLGMRVI
jgi:sodium-dependent dicarboxylate transporter 2/3/5